ncbi:MAG: hypothetical protein ABFC77_09110, partial [Thermoguttaceae bacterium]
MSNAVHPAVYEIVLLGLFVSLSSKPIIMRARRKTDECAEAKEMDGGGEAADCADEYAAWSGGV